MHPSLRRYMRSQKEAFRGRVLMLATAHAHDIMNIEPERATNAAAETALAKMQAKAVELLNNPDTFEKRFAISVAALLDMSVFDDATDEDLVPVIRDVFDGIAGVSAGSGEIEWTNHDSKT